MFRSKEDHLPSLNSSLLQARLDNREKFSERWTEEMAVSKLSASFEVNEALPARVQEKLSGFSNAPTLDEWLTMHLSAEHQRMYKGLMDVRYAAKDQYPIRLDDLAAALGYSGMQTPQERLEGGFQEGQDYSLLKDVLVRTGRGGHNAKPYALTLKCAQLFAVRAQTEQGKRVAAFFVEALEVFQDYHKLTLLLGERTKGLQQRHDFLFAQHPRVLGFSAVYLIIIGTINGKLFVKIGTTDNLPKRLKNLKSCFGECYIYDVIVVRNGSDLENEVKADTFIQKFHLTKDDLPEAFSTQTELYHAEDFSLLDRIGVVVRQLAKKLNTEAEARRIHKERLLELDNETLSSQIRMEEIQVEKIKALKDLGLPPPDLKEVLLALTRKTPVTTKRALEAGSGQSQDDYARYAEAHIVSENKARLPLKDLRDDLDKWFDKRGMKTPHRKEVISGFEEMFGKMYTNSFNQVFLTGWRHRRLVETCDCCPWRLAPSNVLSAGSPDEEDDNS